MKQFRVLCLLAPAVLLATSAPSDLAAYCGLQGEVRYTTTRVVLRAEPSTEAEPLVVIPRGVALEVSCRDSWCATEYDAMEGYVYERLLATQRPAAQVEPARPQRTCCKICTTGQACGNSCISRRYTCHQPPGCACNG